MKVFPNSACQPVPKKKVVKVKAPPPPPDKRLPAERPWYWAHHDDMKKHNAQHVKKHKKSHSWKKKEIRSVIRNLQNLHHHDIHCHMGEAGCAEMEAKHTAKKAAKKVAKRATKKAPKKKLASNYMSLLLRSIYIKQTKQIRDRFKKPEAWCLHFHDKCRAALHDKLMAKQKKMAIATSLITEDSEDNSQLLALKQQVASANAAVAKAKRVLAVTQARRRQKKKAMQT